MGGLGDEDGRPLPLGGVSQAPLHLEAARHHLLEGPFQGGAGQVQVGGGEGHPHEEGPPLGVGGVLLQIGDVGPMGVEETAHGGHDAGPVRTGDEKPRLLHGGYYIPMEARTTDLSDLYPEGEALPMVFKSFGGRARFAGRVRTLRVFEDNALVRKVLEEEGAGQVLFVDGGGSLRTALLGGNLARLAWEKGWAGVVVHGAVRDTEELREVPIGLLALAATPKKSAKEGKGEVDVPLKVLGVEVLPGSFLLADEDGLLLLPEPPSGVRSGG